MPTREQAINILKEAVSSCDPIFPTGVKEAYLYGSYARGDFDADSDIDILLTVDLPPEQVNQYQRKVAYVSSDLSLKHDITVSVTVKSQNQFDLYSNELLYYRNVLTEGIRYGS